MWRGAVGVGLLAVVLSGCGFFTARRPPIDFRVGATQEGIASWYGPGFHGQPTSSGEIYDQYQLTAAHQTLPLGTRLAVTNLRNHRTIEVRINDRGPFVDGRIIDLSYAAARSLDMVGPGTVPVRIEVLGMARREAPARTKRAAGSYAVQVGAFTDRSQARKLERALAQRFDRVHIVELQGASGRYHHVRIGPFSTREEAAGSARRVAALGLPVVIMEADPDRWQAARAPR